MRENGTPADGVVISGQPLLDLSHLKSAAELASISKIEHVAAVVVPEELAAAYAAIPAESVAATVFVPGGSNVRLHTGLLSVGGGGIGAEDDVVVVIGMLVVTSPVTEPVPHRIHVVGSVLAPRGSEQALGKALGGSGMVSYYPYADGQDIKVLTGQARLSPALLANPAGRADDILIVAGQAVVTGEPAAVGYRTVLVAGQFAAPAASRDLLEPAIQIQGQAGWYQGTQPRVFNDDARLGPDFFRLLSEPASVVVLGDLIISADVTEEAMIAKVAGLTVFGDVIAPGRLAGAVQVLADNVFGDIRVAENLDAEGQEEEQEDGAAHGDGSRG